MIKILTFRVLRLSLRNNLPKISSKLYNKIFTYSYRFFLYLKPSQIWIIILALLNKTEFKSLVAIPSMFMLFSTILSDSESFYSKLDKNILNAKLEYLGFYFTYLFNVLNNLSLGIIDWFYDKITSFLDIFKNNNNDNPNN